MKEVKEMNAMNATGEPEFRIYCYGKGHPTRAGEVARDVIVDREGYPTDPNVFLYMKGRTVGQIIHRLTTRLDQEAGNPGRFSPWTIRIMRNTLAYLKG